MDNPSTIATPKGLAELLRRLLKEDDPNAYIQLADLDGRRCVDGKFDLEHIAQRILSALAEANLLRA